ncbi:hypothetical protein [Coleofasciculus sp. FACHB-SPT9]|uniref:hypothetical protein n=1 Tax=Cyanophyceae TaxID=3028117 RepID=UPI001687A5D4|nr:hypothetical protein [Coleofasciculus sp. FACHB-SPT9]MBD1888927.1 hypothetical protein [Coleofasciculus sp. FACHB-SPT9]
MKYFKLIPRLKVGGSALKQSNSTILTGDFDRAIVARGSIPKDGKQQFPIGYEWFLGMSL